MKTLWNFVFRKLPIVSWLDGHKTTLGNAMVVLSALSSLLVQLSSSFPQVSWLIELAGATEQTLVQINEWLVLIGLPTLAIGVMDKKVKGVK